MCAWIVAPPKGLIEPVAVPTIWVDEISAIGITDGVLTAYCSSRREDGEQMLEIIIKARPSIAFDTLAKSVCVIQHMTVPIRGFVPRVVK